MNEKRRSGDDRRRISHEHQGDRRTKNDRRYFVRNSEITIGKLRIIPIFRDLSLEQYRNLVLVCSKISFTKDEEIFHFGSDPSSLFILLEGKLKAFFEDKRELSMLTPKDAIGIMEFFKGEKYHYTLTSVSNCSMIVIKNEEFYSILNRDKDLYIKILSNLVFELYNKINRDNEFISNLYKTNTLDLFNL